METLYSKISRHEISRAYIFAYLSYVRASCPIISARKKLFLTYRIFCLSFWCQSILPRNFCSPAMIFHLSYRFFSLIFLISLPHIFCSPGDWDLIFFCISILLSRRIQFVFLLLFTSKELKFDDSARSDVMAYTLAKTKTHKNRKQHNNSWSNKYHKNTRLSLMRTL